MFGSYGGVETDSPKECKRDWEREAKYLKIKIDIYKDLYNSINKVFTTDSVRYQLFDGRDEQIPFLAMVGGLSLSIPLMEKDYESILKEIEKER